MTGRDLNEDDDDSSDDSNNDNDEKESVDKFDIHERINSYLFKRNSYKDQGKNGSSFTALALIKIF